MPHEKTFELRLLLKTHAESLAATLQSDEFKAEDVLLDFGTALSTVESFLFDMDRIEGNVSLSTVGKNEQRLKLGSQALAALRTWRDKAVAGLDRTEAAAQSAIAAASKPAPSSEQEVEAMRGRIAPFSVQETQALYAAADDDRTRRALEGVAALTHGIVPVKTGQGVRWLRLLDQAVVEKARAERAAKAAPVSARRLADVSVVKPVYRVVFSVAERITRDYMARHGVRETGKPAVKDPRTGAPVTVPAA